MSEKKSNTFLGIAGLILIATLLYFVFNWFLTLLSVLKTFDAVIIVAIITGLVTIVTTTAKSILDIRQARLQYLTQKRELSYYHFIEMIYKINQFGQTDTTYSSEEQIKDLLKFSKEITLWGSKNVVEKWTEFRKVANSEYIDGGKLLKLSEQIMNEMRNDLGVSKVKEKALLSIFINDIENLE